MYSQIGVGALLLMTGRSLAQGDTARPFDDRAAPIVERSDASRPRVQGLDTHFCPNLDLRLGLLADDGDAEAGTAPALGYRRCTADDPDGHTPRSLLTRQSLESRLAFGAFQDDATPGTPSTQSADEVARSLANPNTPLATLTFKNQYRSYRGDLPQASSQSNYTLLFQPTFPFALGTTASGGEETLFFRPAFPLVVEQPVFNADRLDFDGTTAFGDIGFDIGYGVTEKDGVLWALGMVGTLPTATDGAVGGGQLRLGPEVLLAKFEEWGVYGVFPSHQWDVTGWRDPYYSVSQMQVFLDFFLGEGWVVGSNPIMNYDWRSSEWTIPLQLDVSKTVKLGDTPWKFSLEINYYVERPDAFGPEWMIGFNVAPVVNNFLESLFGG